MSSTYDVQDLVTTLAERLVAELGAAEMRRLLDALQLPGVEPEAVFRREGQFWTLQYAGRTTRLRDARGLRHLARLLAQPGRPVHVLALVGDSGARGTGRGDDGAPLHVSGDDGQPALDERARSSYRQRLRDLDDELAEARVRADEGQVWRLSGERDFLLRELGRAVGLGGRDRRLASPTERARVAVRKAVQSALATLDEHHPELGEHLRTTVRTGTFCCYCAVDRPVWRC